MWRSLTALVVLATAAATPALAQIGSEPAETGGAAVPPAAAEPEAAPTGGVVVGREPVPPRSPAPPPAPAPVPPPSAEPEREELPERGLGRERQGPAPKRPANPGHGLPALTALTDLDPSPRPRAAAALRAQPDDPLKDLPQLAPPAREEPSPPPDPEPPTAAPQPKADEPRLADTGLEALLLAYVGFVLLAIGLATFAVLRKARRLLDRDSH